LKILDSPGDNEIIALILDKKTANRGFEELVRKYKQQIYWHIRRFVLDHDESNDVVQEVFIKIWKNLGKFRKESKLYTWIYKIATNEAISYVKRNKRKVLPLAGNYYENLSNSLTDDNYFDGDEIQLRFQKALLTLPEKQHMVFNLKYFNEMKYEDISEIMGTSVGALKASFHLAVKKIENYVTKI